MSPWGGRSESDRGWERDAFRSQDYSALVGQNNRNVHNLLTHNGLTAALVNISVLLNGWGCAGYDWSRRRKPFYSLATISMRTRRTLAVRRIGRLNKGRPRGHDRGCESVLIDRDRNVYSSPPSIKPCLADFLDLTKAGLIDVAKTEIDSRNLFVGTASTRKINSRAGICNANSFKLHR